MRYDYVCKQHDPVLIFEVQHEMLDTPTILCPECGNVAQKLIGAGFTILVPRGDKRFRFPSRPGDREYRAYRRWENNGGDPRDPLRKDFLAERGDLDERK